MAYCGVIISEHSPIKNNVINSHPALLRRDCSIPGKTPTKTAYERYINGKHTYTGATIHQVTSVVDGGPILIDKEVSIKGCYREEQLRSRFYAGFEVSLQVEALKDNRLRKIDWSLYKPIKSKELVRNYN